MKNPIKNHLEDLQINISRVLRDSFILFVFGLLIIWSFNYFNQYESVKDEFHTILKNAELIILITVIGFLFFKSGKQWKKQLPQILGFVIAFSIFMISDFDEYVFRDLWEERNYPAVSIMFDFFNFPPIDPFQIIMYFPIFLTKGFVEKEIVFLNKLISQRISQLV